jgi:hypothetical protein
MGLIKKTKKFIKNIFYIESNNNNHVNTRYYGQYSMAPLPFTMFNH